MSSFLPPVTFDIDVNAKNFKTGMQGVNDTLKQTSAVADKTSKSFGGMTKSAERATSAVRALSLVKALFVAYGVKELLDLQNAYNNLGSALANVGISTAETRKQAQDLSESYQKLGFDSSAAANGLATLVTATGDLAKSERLLGIAANYARAQHTSLEDASRLILSASRGNIKVFSQFGITLDTTVSKTKALEKAMAELELRLKDRAKNATNDLSVQVQILKQQLMGFVETIAAYVMPWVSKFVKAIISATDWIKQHKEALKIVGFVLSTLVLTAIVNVTRALYAQAAAWVAANWEIVAIVAAVLAVAAAFVYLWNKFEGFRKGFSAYMKFLVQLWGGVVSVILLGAKQIVDAFQYIYLALSTLVRGFANSMIKLGEFFNKPDWVSRGKSILKDIDKGYADINRFGDNLDNWRANVDKTVDAIIKKIDEFKNQKIDTSKFKLPKFDIPTFTNGKTISSGIDSEIKAGLDKAAKRIADFNSKMKSQFTEMGKIFSSIVTRDFNAEILAKIGDPIDQVIYDAQSAIDSYYAASNQYKSSTETLTKAQKAYVEALKTGNQELIDGADSALSAAEDATAKVYDNMAQSLADLKNIQTQMIQKVADLYGELNNLEKERTKTLKDAEAQRVELLASYNDQKKKLNEDYDKSVLKAEQEAAKRRAEIIQQSIDLLRNAFKSATYRSVGDIYQALTFEGRYIKGGTTEKILKALGLQTQKAKTLAADAAQLAGLGFSQEFIQEVVSQGPDIGHKLAQTIINSTPESITKMQEYWNQLQATSSHGVDNVAKTLNTGITLATEELTNQLKQVDIDLKANLVDLQQTLTDSLAEAFDSYSKSLEKINTETAKQILEIDDQMAQLRAKIDMLKSSLAGIGTISAPGAGGAAPSVIPRAEITEEEGIATSCASGRGKFKVTKYNGVEMSRVLISCITPAEVPPSGVPSGGDLADAQAALDAANAAAEDAANVLLESQKAIFATLSPKEQFAQMSGFSSDDIQEIQSIKRMRAGGFNPNNITINVSARTDASPQEIGSMVGWVMRTSGDVQYRAPRGGAVLPD